MAVQIYMSFFSFDICLLRKGQCQMTYLAIRRGNRENVLIYHSACGRAILPSFELLFMRPLRQTPKDDFTPANGLNSPIVITLYLAFQFQLKFPCAPYMMGGNDADNDLNHLQNCSTLSTDRLLLRYNATS